ncbi:MAG: hypothetical protein QXT06_05030 [Candidatus Bathyarchaeia archaeon]
MAYYEIRLVISRISPLTLYMEVASILLNPEIKTTGLLYYPALRSRSKHISRLAFIFSPHSKLPSYPNIRYANTSKNGD